MATCSWGDLVTRIVPHSQIKSIQLNDAPSIEPQQPIIVDIPLHQILA